MFYDALFIFLMAILGIWKAIPLGLFLKAEAVTIFSMTALGGITGVLILFFFGDLLKKIRDRKRRGQGSGRQWSTARRLFERYGAPGLGILGSLVIGPNPTIIIGLLMVKSRFVLLYWTLAGTVIWSFVLTMAGVYSIELFHELTENLTLFG